MAYDLPMVEILTLLIGLTVGAQDIEVAVPPETARVELYLDGESRARLDGPPWRASVDFGEVLAPRELLAVARDGQGEELGRAEQWVNLPRGAAEARLIPVGLDARGAPSAMRLSWESGSGEPPTSVVVTFDGRPIPAPQPAAVGIAAIPLPEHDPADLHFVTAELIFADGSEARAEATFGGVHGSEIHTELTAVPVRLPERTWERLGNRSGGEPTPEQVSGWLRHGDRLPTVVAVERGPADVVLVRSRQVEALLRRLRAEALRVARQRSRILGRARGSDGLRFDMGLEPDDRLIFLWPAGVDRAHPRFDEVGLFYGQAESFRDGGVYWYLTRLYPDDPSLAEGPQRLADAVAVAGRRAASADRRRAVVLVVERESEDHGRHAAASVRSYLGSLGVPLHVWSSRPLRGEDPARAWGDSRPIHGLDRLRSAVEELKRDLERQRILWVRGRWMPHEMEPGPRAPDELEVLARPGSHPESRP